MNVFWNVAGQCQRVVGICVCKGVEPREDRLQLRSRQDAGSSDGVRMRFACSDLLRQQTPVERKRTLPALEILVQRLPETP